ncbi:TonB-dependent receptor domain-containing protein [Nitrincola sp.]|uniref:TonB-dependent receptor domain-containing protein n=1 Tax=Nitrincola sp. TaxID=1926584 RepID=UPI003A8FAA24
MQTNITVYQHVENTWPLRTFITAMLACIILSAPSASAQTAMDIASSTETEDEQDQAAQPSTSDITLFPLIIQHSLIDIDEQGYNDVYDKNITNLYIDRESLQRYQTANPGDIFKGMNGVYSMDTRSSQSITPNIRGITGEGRTPLTVDGTEQSTNVWLHFFGAGNRSYLDTALVRSVEVEKGPSLSRGITSGVGGAVNVRTIEPNDIIPEGNSFGIEVDLETSGNTSKPRFDATSVYGQDYRDIPGTERTAVTTINVPSQDPRIKGDDNILNFEDNSGMLAIAGRNDFMDVLLAHSERSSGNYYAGKSNADKYSGHDPYAEDTTDRYIPNLTKLYYPGNEVFNTSNETKTTLFKNNWYFPNNQQLSLQFMRTDLKFGETTPGQSILLWGYREGAEQAEPDRDWANERQFVYEFPHSELRLDRYKLSYDFKPEGSNWLNLETSLWHTKTEGTRYQTGAAPYTIDVDQATYDELNFWETVWEEVAPGMIPEPEHDGTIVSRGRQWTSHDRTGFDFSNQMQLTDSLQFTVGGGYQKETLDEKITGANGLTSTTGGVAPDSGMLFASSDRLGPRSGERKEYSAMMNLAWQPTNWLTLTAGTRYLHYTGKDTGTAERRRQQEAFFAAKRVKTGERLVYGELLTEEKADTYNTLLNNRADADAALTPADWDARANGMTTPAMAAWEEAGAAFNAFRGDGVFRDGNTSAYYWTHEVFVPMVDGKLDSSQSPLADSPIDPTETATTINSQGQVVEAPVRIYDRTKTAGTHGAAVYEDIEAGQAWDMPEEQSGEAFSPVLSATARVTSHGTAFVRYAQTTRFPSINELTSSAIIDGAGTVGNLAVNGASKPERSTNWEVGYSHNLTQFFPALALADVRVSYYNTEIEDLIDRTFYYDVIQYDKKKTSGIELQSRFDTGGFYGSLGASYRLKQELCDKDYAYSMDPYYNRIPSCVTGGFPGTYSGSSLLPRYSIDMTLGTRLLNSRLDMGWRGTYHSAVKNDQLDKLLASEQGVSDYNDYAIRDAWFRQGVDTFYTPSVLLHDLYTNFQVNPSITFNLGVTNVTDEYYLDPMAKTLMPGPGRTLTAGLKVNF